MSRGEHAADLASSFPVLPFGEITHEEVGLAITASWLLFGRSHPSLTLNLPIPRKAYEREFKGAMVLLARVLCMISCVSSDKRRNTQRAEQHVVTACSC